MNFQLSHSKWYPTVFDLECQKKLIIILCRQVNVWRVWICFPLFFYTRISLRWVKKCKEKKLSEKRADENRWSYRCWIFKKKKKENAWVNQSGRLWYKNFFHIKICEWGRRNRQDQAKKKNKNKMESGFCDFVGI